MGGWLLSISGCSDVEGGECDACGVMGGRVVENEFAIGCGRG